MQVKFEESGKPLKRSRNRHGETCEEQLRRMCKNIAQEITDGLKIDDTSGTGTVTEWMDGVYDIEWITHQDKTYKAARLLVAGGGPSIWVNLQRKVVQGYWWGDYCECPFVDNIGLDDDCEELYGC